MGVEREQLGRQGVGNLVPGGAEAKEGIEVDPIVRPTALQPGLERLESLALEASCCTRGNPVPGDEAKGVLVGVPDEGARVQQGDHLLVQTGFASLGWSGRGIRCWVR
jgi:hypothetical protein